MNKPGEIVTIFIGQAGVQVATSCWELFCLEHGIKTDGFMHPGYDADDKAHQVFFSTAQTGKLSPRTLLVDLEPNVIDEVRTGAYKELFNPNSLLHGKEDAANNFARGYYTVGREAIESVLDRLRREVENASRPAGFIVFRSFGGGTGSGFTTLLLEGLLDDYGKKTKVDFSIYPSPNISTVIVEPYNSVLTTHGTLDYEDVCFLVDNEALYDICSKRLKLERPNYTNLNRLEAQVVSAITASLRFEGALNVDLQEFQTNLVPYPRIHFPIMSFAPILHKDKARLADISENQITHDCFDPSNQMVKCDTRTGAYMSCCLLYRGDVNPTKINHAIHTLKGNKSIRFCEWNPTGFKVGINYQAPVVVPQGDLPQTDRSLTILSNNTSIRHSWNRIASKFDAMFKKKAFLHHYLAEGMEQSVFKEAREDISALMEDYNEIEN